ncbi:MAG: undecaprenyl-phosphate alpha-N-acetylglucosaminyl 1-phosphate transferase [Gammaproteobacteria bacterium]|nr:undecaprenyl-phosphate alpha-N-acetylglucosaminyl 1-phosphate transferase [Gammaproteobacteria bacterium]
MELLSSIAVSFFVTLGLCWLLPPLATKLGLVDKPGGRKHHDAPTPVIGGIAIYAGLVCGVAVNPYPIAAIWPLIAGAGLLLTVGLIDDIKNLSARTRFFAQSAAAIVAILGNDIVLHDLGNLIGTGTLSLGLVAIPFTVFAIIGVINAVNMSDGMDGLAGGLVLVAIAGLAIAALPHLHGYAVVLIFLASTVAAFLMFNMRTPWLAKAKIFMGDNGSMMLGFIVACLLIHLSQTTTEARTIRPVTALWLLALPLLDTVCVMLRRIRKGKSPFAPDREHFHHILLVAGYSPAKTVWIMLGIASGLAALGLLGERLHTPESVMFVGFMLLFAAYYWGMSHAWRVMKAIRSSPTL